MAAGAASGGAAGVGSRGIAVMLHHAELWLHGVLVLAEVIVGIAIGKAVLIILCAVVYAAATVFLQMLDKREEADGR